MQADTDLSLSDEEQEIQRSVRRFLGDAHPLSMTRELIEHDVGFDTAVWERLAVEIGVAGLAIPQRLGGQGYGVFELGLVSEELGRNLVPGPFLPTVAVASVLLLGCGENERAHELLSDIAAARTTATVVLGDFLPQQNGFPRAEKGARGGWELTGSCEVVPDAGPDSALLSIATVRGDLGLFAVDAGRGVDVDQQVSTDLTRRFKRVSLDRASAELLSVDRAELRRALDVATTVMTAESLGAAQACLDMTIEYAKERIQFGRPIGSFQYVKHACADMLMSVEGLRSAVVHALRSAADPDVGQGELAAATSLAKRLSDAVFDHVARQTIQLHGGIGFTWEHDAHLFLRRAVGNRQLLGDPAWHAQRLERLLELA